MPVRGLLSHRRQLPACPRPAYLIVGASSRPLELCVHVHVTTDRDVHTRHDPTQFWICPSHQAYAWTCTYTPKHTVARKSPLLHIIYPYLSPTLLSGTSLQSRVPLLQARPAKRIERRAPPRRLHKTRTYIVSGARAVRQLEEPLRTMGAGLFPRMPSTFSTIAGVNLGMTSSALRLSTICSGFEAPRMTVDVFGLRAIHASARCDTLHPRSTR